jgi:dTDP-4-amino-4,6-dideoxygalactose transaminase
LKRIPHSRPLLGREEQRAVRRVIAGGHVAQGTEVEAFEGEMAHLLERRYAAAVNSGTAALHLALSALGVGPGDYVALPSYVCSALLHAVSYVDAEPLLIDIDPSTFNIDPQDLRRRINSRTRAVIVPHMFGLPADIDEIRAAGLPIIEDCAVSLGARYRDKPVGSLGTLTVISFYATKMLATGEGGMVLGDNFERIEHVRDLRSYDGRPRHRARYNYKMSDMMAAMGRVQLRRLNDFIRRRRRLAEQYLRALSGGPWELPKTDSGHVFYRFVIRSRRAVRRLLSEIDKRSVEAHRPVFKPLHRYLGLEGFPGAEEAHRRAVSIPLYPALTGKEADHVIKSVSRAGRIISE